MPLHFWEGRDRKVFLLLLPADAIASSEQGLLVFTPPGITIPSAAERTVVAVKAPQSAKPEGERTIADWKALQDQFKDLPKLPPDWIRVKSRSDNSIYFWNMKTQKSQVDFPLPSGWTKQASKTTGKVYYFHARKRIS